MEESLLNVLNISIEHIKKLSDKAKGLCNSIIPDSPEEKIFEAEVNVSKLESGLERLRDALNNYFRMAVDPAVDDISQITVIQLEAEENLCELQVRLKRIKPSSRDGALLVAGKLPKLCLPEFHGDILHFNEFWDQFQSLVGNRNLNDVDKLLYLVSALRGDAKKLIEGLTSTNKNYSIAVNLLKSRYGRTEMIKDAHYSALNKIKSAEGTTVDCRRVLNEIEKHLRVLSSLGEDTTHSYLRFLILEKFPEELVYELKKKTKDESVAEIRKELEELISAKEDANRLTTQKKAAIKDNYTTETLHVTESFRRTNSKENYNNDKDTRDRLNFHSSGRGYKRKLDTSYDVRSRECYTDRQPFKRTKRSCVFCNAFGHFDDECRRYRTIHQRMIQLRGRCYRCLRRGHTKDTCIEDKACFHCKDRDHHRVLCPRKGYPEEQRKEESLSTQSRKSIGEDNKANRGKNSTVQCHINEDGPTVLQTAIVDLKKEGDIHRHKCRALLDSGSMRSYITQSLAKKLNLEMEDCRLTIFTFGSQVPQEVNSPRVKLEIMTRSGKAINMCANVVPMITHSIPYFGHDQKLEKSKFDLADDGSLADKIDLLIGNDYYHTILLTKKIKISENLYMIDSELGWIVSGKMDSKLTNELEVVTYVQTNLEVKLNQPDLPLNEANIKELWELESIGIVDSPKENRDEEAIRHFNETTKFEDGRYQVTWPFLEYPPDLGSNFGLALGRLVGLMKRLDDDTQRSYDQLLREQKELGIIEVVPDEDIDNSSNPVHYLPHHCVKQTGKPIRIVYDASSKVKDSKSLNQCLYCGPLMLEDLTGLLLKFRSHNIGICADVEKAFLQIGLQKKDREVTRFLWIKDLGQPINDTNILHMRFCRVPFGVITSPFLLNATIKYHLSQASLQNVRNLAQEIYVDNMVTGTETVDEAIDLYENSKQVFQDMSMNLRDWSSNSKNFLKDVPDKCLGEVVKVLGLDWKLPSDTLHLRLKRREYPDTKRGVLQCIASIYDPCGFTVPYTISAKIFLQDLWKLKIKWDCPLSRELKDKWRNIQDELENSKETCIPRCYIKDFRGKDYSIHCFTDASTKSYAAVVYIAQGNERSFVIGKSRLVPVKDSDNLKIPRLELLAATIGHRLIQYVRRFLPENITQQILWTDSQIVISWYYSDKLLTPFVARRIQEMKKNKVLQLRYVPTDLNPADVATRSAQPKEEVKRWLTGPDFLSKDPSQWPAVLANSNTLLAGEGLPDGPIDINDRRETNNSDNIPNKVLNKDIGIVYTTVAEIKKIQAKHFPEELAGKETHLKRNLDLFTDADGILRCKGRFKYTNWTYDKRYPILIPSRSLFTDEIIMKTHIDNYHVGATHTLSIIRHYFWIPQGKRQVLRVIKNCAQCIKHGGGPFRLPPTPALPPERVNYSEPYTFTGVDYLGPILVNTKAGSEKRWICLFTCLAVRAVHLEVVNDLTAEEGLLALRRFISTRNVPTVITSDNATNFKLMSEVLTQPYCTDRKIKWRFIPQLAPWFGGFYERLVGIVKICMKKTLQKHLLTDNQLNTIVKEIEAVINSRPLTHVDEELTHILRPSDFIAMGRTITLDTNTDGPLPQGSRAKNDLVNSWKRGLTILNEFKEIFVNQYLLSLRERYSHSLKQARCTSKLEPAEGQIVQIKGDSKNREGWKVGKITTLIKGGDGMHRVAKVKVGNQLYTRSVSQLYPLEVEEVVSNEATSSPVIRKDVGPTCEEFEDVQDKDFYMEAETISESHIQENGEQESFNDTQSITEDIALIKTTSPKGINIDGINADDTTGTSSEPRQPRDAAVRAREKIWQWTRSLMSLLSAVGSVAND